MARLTLFQASAACVVLKGVSAVFSALPLSLALWAGRRLGESAYWLNPKNRRKVYQHLRIAFGRTKSQAFIEKTAWDIHHIYGQNIIEIARLSLIPKEGFGKYVSVEGLGHIDALLRKGHGLIFLSIHSGNWELSNMVGSLTGHPYNMVANYLEHVSSVADLLDSWRTSGGCKIINPGIGGREIIKALKRNEIVTLVADQGGSDGMMIPFLGRESSMSTGAVRIALKYDIPVCLVDIYRLANGRHCLRVLPFEISRTADTDVDVRFNMVRIAGQFQSWTEEHPSEYLWFYKTWKYARDRRIVILDDGRTGHYRQSQALARQVILALCEQGLEALVETVPVHWRNRYSPVLFGILSSMRPLFAGAGVSVLKPFLTPESYTAIGSVKADIVISCGARNSWVNVWLSADNDARSICILRPGGPGSALFDLLVMPRHDAQGVPAANILLTKVAPNLIDKVYLEENACGLMLRFPHLRTCGHPVIGLFIGGDTKGLVLTGEQVRSVISQLKVSAEKYNASILVTTSRRTSREVEAIVIRELQDCPRAALVIIASRNNVPEAVGGILGLSEVVIVSGESVSMVSEAVSSGKKAIVFPVDGPGQRPLDNKYSRFVGMMSHDEHVVCARTAGIADAVDRVLSNKAKIRMMDDNMVILEAVRKIVR